jgi:hypothetical protein
MGLNAGGVVERPEQTERFLVGAPSPWVVPGVVGQGAELDELPHAVAAADLGQYASLVRRGAWPAAVRAFPAVTAHLAAGCPACCADLAEALEVLGDG